MDRINLEKNINLENQKNSISNMNNALSNIFSNVINWSIDAAIKYFLPDSIENEVIKIKDNLLNKNVQEKIKETVDNVTNSINQKSKFSKEDISDIKNVEALLKNSETIKTLSSTVENILEEINLDNNKNKEKKNFISENIEANLDIEIKKQINSINKIEEYKNDWYKNYEEKNFNSMNKAFNNIKKEIKNILPLENLIKEIRKIENLNELIKSKGGDFNLTKEELELANKLIV